MNVYDLILKTRNGRGLCESEINFLIENYTQGKIPDYQMSAWCMAVYFQGMKADEISYLTMAMANSGMRYDLSSIKGIKIDKHSTGGVGDTTTLIVAPLVAACGVPVAKMSGRGLGHTGGTLDKLSSIPGFTCELSQAQFIEQVNQIKLAIIGQSAEITPADKKLYALRDVTATVDSLPLIASSIMSKKLAAGADGFVLDVKAGVGGFMQNVEQATELAKIMVAIGKQANKPTVAVITNMDQPLGCMVGNALEVQEAILTLSGEGAADLTELCLELASEMLVLAKHSRNYSEARQLLEKKLSAKAGLVKFGEMIAYQGGNAKVIEDLGLLPKAKRQIAIVSQQTGYINSINALEIGKAAMTLGAGRQKQDQSIDLAVGIELKKKVGDYVETGDILGFIHANQESGQVLEQVLSAFSIQPNFTGNQDLIYNKITSL
ncbi:MAG: pyrimidine-nucleoside phosphorylase [Firmicutes bacterium]|nr:pyrimidine-nucleoside phosphorylase [Bacillota bacterium]